jgi:16S rRNA (guanine527-N7)-methyltransferase
VAEPRDLRERLAAGAQDLALALTDSQKDALLTLLSELEAWNSRFNLTAIRNRADMLTKHVLDSLAVQAHLHGRTVADVGTGAGFPGLPLAIVDAERAFTLIEATTKKARFLEHVIAQLGLANVTVVNARAERYRPSGPGFDTVLARALGQLSEFVRLAGHLCAPKGRLLAMKGKAPQAEIDRLARGWRVAALKRLKVPGLDAERHLVELVRSPSADDAPRKHR